jgi:hypothetical protein
VECKRMSTSEKGAGNSSIASDAATTMQTGRTCNVHDVPLTKLTYLTTTLADLALLLWSEPVGARGREREEVRLEQHTNIISLFCLCV